jgi:hypothetical protein
MDDIHIHKFGQQCPKCLKEHPEAYPQPKPKRKSPSTISRRKASGFASMVGEHGLNYSARSRKRAS